MEKRMQVSRGWNQIRESFWKVTYSRWMLGISTLFFKYCHVCFQKTKITEWQTGFKYSPMKFQQNRRLTRAADLRRAAAAAVANDGHHPCAEAGASLLAAAAHRAQRRVWLAAVCALLGVDLSAHAGTLQHAAAHGRSHLPTGERRRSVTLWPGVFDRCCY